MKNAASSSPTVTQLERKLAAADAENARLLALMEKKEAQWKATKQSLFEQFRLALERQFGPSTEKYRVDQRELLINEAEVAVDEEDASGSDATADDATIDTATPAKRRTRGGRVVLPPELPRVEVIHELPDDARHCRDDGTALKVIGEEVSEELHVVPARIEVIAMCDTNMPARCAKRASTPPQRRPSCCPRAMPAPRCSPISRRLNTRTRYRFIGRARSLPAMAPRSPAIPWHAGWCRRGNGSSR